MNVYKNLRDALYAFYVYLQRLIVPGLRDSQYLYIDRLLQTVNSDSTWLDLGCGHRIVPAWTSFDESTLAERGRFIVGVDRDIDSLARHRSLHARVVADIDALPFQTGVFNLVTANMVVEHLSEPESSLREIARVLSDRGTFLFHTVNILHYNAFISSLLPEWLKIRLVTFLEGRPAQDVYPTHYYLNTLASVRAIARRTGFNTCSVEMVNSSAEMVMLGPIVLVELIIIRVLNRARFVAWRSNIIATLNVIRQPNSEVTLPCSTMEQTTLCS